jgi:ubiquinone/menaquinone biosynthesis C-methylase UbiE
MKQMTPELNAIDVKSGYDAWSSSYDIKKNVLIELDKLHEIKRRHAFKRLASVPKKALDLCCGTGRHLNTLEQHFEETTAIDFSQNMIEKAVRRSKKKNTKIICQDVLKHDFGQTRFDFINFSLALMHFESLSGIILCIKSLLRPKGLLFLVDAESEFLLSGSKPRCHLNNKKMLISFQIRDSLSVAKSLTQAGLDILEYEVIPFNQSLLKIAQKFTRYEGLDCLHYILAQKR